MRAAAPALLVLLAACRGEPPASGPPSLARLVDSLTPAVEAAAGLRFRAPVRAELRSRASLEAFIAVQLERELPPARRRGLEAAYRLFGFLPDSLDLRALLLGLYVEQVAGFYDPESRVLVAIEGADAAQLRLVFAHELVHALQGQYLPLDSILRQVSNSDRRTAAQAVLEGQATLVSLRAITPGEDPAAQPGFFDLVREQIDARLVQMPALRAAPVVFRRGLVFPYVEGAAFLQWWGTSPLRDTLPFGPRMPVSTEQVLHPDRLLAGDQPRAVTLAGPRPVLYSDVLGELEVRLLAEALTGRALGLSVVPLGWGGDRFAIEETDAGPALTWVAVWDDARARARAEALLAAPLRGRARPGYRAAWTLEEVGGAPATRFVFAPAGWAGWEAPLVARLGE